ncbi:MAG: hypothetical protein OEV45_12790 [Desulfobacteraceae bacterium]|nr:hypothetical protein [Desulfobacteraceae bacterium]
MLWKQFNTEIAIPEDKRRNLEKILEIDSTNVAARDCLNRYYNNIRDPWCRAISECLLGKQTEQSLTEKAQENSEYLLTAYVALGLWAEGSGEKKKAIRHYKEAMASCLEKWLEYDLAKKRIRTLKRQIKLEQNLRAF